MDFLLLHENICCRNSLEGYTVLPFCSSVCPFIHTVLPFCSSVCPFIHTYVYTCAYVSLSFNSGSRHLQFRFFIRKFLKHHIFKALMDLVYVLPVAICSSQILLGYTAIRLFI